MEKKSLATRKYVPLSSSSGFWAQCSKIIQDFPVSRSLGYRFALRNVSAKYRQSIFGFFWLLIPPLLTSVIWIFLQSNNLVKFNAGSIPYPVFVVSGTVIWQIFVSAVNSPLQMVNQNRGLLVKINFPRESIFISGFYEVFFNALITTMVGICVIMLFGIMPDWKIIFLIPAIILIIFSGLMIGLFLMPFGILFKDIQMGLPFFFQILMYLSSVIFPSEQVPALQPYIDNNPISVQVNFIRHLFTGQPVDSFLTHYLIVILISVILLILALVFVRICMEILLERMGV